MADAINIALVNNTAKQYKQELLKMATLSVDEAIKHMSVMAGVQDEVVLSSLLFNSILKPYTSTWTAAEKGSISPRTLKVRPGKVELEEEPEKYRSTFLGKALTGAVNPKTHPFERDMLEAIAAMVAEDLNSALFAGRYDISGTTALDVFDGFDKIIDDEITATNISVAKGNMYATGAITSANAIDKLKGMYRGAHKVLRKMKTKMFMSHEVYDMYCDDYQATNGSLPYNQQFEKTILEGSNGLCELVPLSSMSGQRVILTVDKNMVIGVDQESDKETILVTDRGQVWTVSFALKLIFGVQIACIDQRIFLVNDRQGSSGSGSE